MFSLRSKAAPASPLGGGLIGAGSPRDSYDMLPYLSRCIPQTQPDNLALAAILRGIEPVPVDRASVLELGCASGGNLIPGINPREAELFRVRRSCLRFDLSVSEESLGDVE